MHMESYNSHIYICKNVNMINHGHHPTSLNFVGFPPGNATLAHLFWLKLTSPLGRRIPCAP